MARVARVAPQDGTRVVSASHDKTVKIWDVGGVDAQRVSAPVKRAQQKSVRNVARGVEGLGRGTVVPECPGAGGTYLPPPPPPHQLPPFLCHVTPSALRALQCVAVVTHTSLRDSRYKTLGMLHKVMTNTRSVNVRSPVFNDTVEFPKTGGAIAPLLGSHGDAVLCIVVSPDGTKAATGSWGQGEGCEQCVRGWVWERGGGALARAVLFPRSCWWDSVSPCRRLPHF